ncbi:hypothetical protein D3C80_1574230 [compost metagenome]
MHEQLSISYEEAFRYYTSNDRRYRGANRQSGFIAQLGCQRNFIHECRLFRQAVQEGDGREILELCRQAADGEGD